MRYLDFRDVENKKEIYEMIYDGLHGAGGYSGLEIRTLDKILNKIEAIGKATREIATTFKGYSLEGGVVALEDTEYNFLKGKLDQVQWVAINRSRVVKMYDFIENAPTSDPEKLN